MVKGVKSYRYCWFCYALKRHDQHAGASAANRERRVTAVGTWFSQLVIRPTLIEAAVAVFVGGSSPSTLPVAIPLRRSIMTGNVPGEIGHTGDVPPYPKGYAASDATLPK